MTYLIGLGGILVEGRVIDARNWRGTIASYKLMRKDNVYETAKIIDAVECCGVGCSGNRVCSG